MSSGRFIYANVKGSPETISAALQTFGELFEQNFSGELDGKTAPSPANRKLVPIARGQKRLQVEVLPPRPAYPNHPGSKRSGTSEDSAIRIAPRSETLRERVLESLTTQGPGTADEVAERLGETSFAIRPRFTELLRAKRIQDTGVRRKNLSGHFATVWEAGH